MADGKQDQAAPREMAPVDYLEVQMAQAGIGRAMARGDGVMVVAGLLMLGRALGRDQGEVNEMLAVTRGAAGVSRAGAEQLRADAGAATGAEQQDAREAPHEQMPDLERPGEEKERPAPGGRRARK